MAEDDDDDYEIGFGKPPVSGRFKPGRSGNPKGRPKGRKNVASLFHKVCSQKVKVKGPDGYQHVTKLEAALTQLANKATLGDIKAISALIRFAEHMPIPEALMQSVIQVNFIAAENGKRKYPVIDGNTSKVNPNDDLEE